MRSWVKRIGMQGWKERELSDTAEVSGKRGGWEGECVVWYGDRCGVQITWWEMWWYGLEVGVIYKNHRHCGGGFELWQSVEEVSHLLLPVVFFSKRGELSQRFGFPLEGGGGVDAKPS